MKKFDEITIYSDDIKSTESFKKLSFINQKAILNRTSRRSIQNAVNICANIGFDNWMTSTQSNFKTIDVVKDLLIIKKVIC